MYGRFNDLTCYIKKHNQFPHEIWYSYDPDNDGATEIRIRATDKGYSATVASQGTNPVDLDTLLETIKTHSTRVRLLRFDENDSRLETSFLVEFKHLSDLQMARAALRELSSGLEITFLDNRGVI